MNFIYLNLISERPWHICTQLQQWRKESLQELKYLNTTENDDDATKLKNNHERVKKTSQFLKLTRDGK